MMDNFAETRIDHNRAKQLEAIAETIEFRGELEANENKQNFAFGAEIVKTKIMPQKVVEKVNLRKITKTLSADEAEDEAPTTTEKLASSGANADNEDGDEDDEDDSDDDDSYQTDEDIENDSQQQLQPHGSRREQLESDEDETTSDSNYSDLSGMSGREWKPISARPINWVQKQIHSGANPRELLSQMLPSSAHQIAPDLNDMTLWRILASMLSEPPRRQKLRYINTFEDVIDLVLQSENIIVLTGAGVSVSCGIPDFRSSDGIYSRLAKDFPDLPDPQAMFDINYFSRDPRPFYKFAREIYPGQFKPSPCHRFIKLLEQKQKLLRNYTQNIDTLEQVAGIRNVIECHGSFSTASCTKCKFKCNADAIRPEIFTQRIPVCPRCQPNVQQSVDASEPVCELELKRLVENGIMKPDIVFFGEGLPEEFHTVMASDKDKCDLLIVMGSSLKVRPVALIPSSIPANVPQILINREQLHHLEFDVELLGDSDVIINQLCHRLGDDWQSICFNDEVLKESKELLPLEEDTDIAEEGEDDVQQLQDTDTQSVKSNASTDIALRSAGAYSDSGFESSTSSGLVGGGGIGKANTGGVGEAIEKIKTSILGLNEPLTKTKIKSADLLPPDLLEDHTNTVDFGNPGFHPFAERLGQQSASSYAENYRHLSIDSSKDSGIQCDSSNSALASNSVSALLPPITNFGDSGGTLNTSPSSSAAHTNVASASRTVVPTAAAEADKTAIKSPPPDSKAAIAVSNEHEMKLHLQKQQQSAAERLLDGTYYCHESSASYVFPGAQVSWSTDSEEDEDNDDDERVYNDVDDIDADTNTAPLSPLLPPSVEAEMVSEITTTTSAVALTASSNKRRSAETIETEIVASTCYHAASATCSSSSPCTSAHLSNKATAASTSTSIICHPPPGKKRRDSCGTQTQQSTGAAAFITTTINSATTSSNGHSSSLAKSSNPIVSLASTEALLQTL